MISTRISWPDIWLKHGALSRGVATGMGNDTDTVAAMAGSLAGAHAGEVSVPVNLLDRLERRDQIVRLADRLAARVQ